MYSYIFYLCVSDEGSSKLIIGLVVGIIGTLAVVGIVYGLKARSRSSNTASNSSNKGESDVSINH